MASASTPATRIKRFSGSNYPAWKNRVFTELQCEDLTELVERKATDEFKKKIFGTTKKPLSWSQADARARRVIIENLDDSLLHYAPTDMSAFDIWKRLKTTFCRTSYLQHAYLRRKLANLRFDGKRDLLSFFREFDEIVSEIRSSGGKVGKVEDIEAVVTLLACLPTEFSPVIASLGDINENSLVTLDTLKGQLLDFDLKRSDESRVKKGESSGDRAGTAYLSDSAGDAALASDTKSGKVRGKVDTKGDAPVCDYCHKSGHRENRCFKRHDDRRSRNESHNRGEASIGEGGSHSSPRSIAFIAENCTASKPVSLKPRRQQIVFVVDSGCTRFMVRDRSYFSSCEKLSDPVSVNLADRSSTAATHSGTIEAVTNLGKRITLNDVLYVPRLRRNLLSVRRITQKGFTVSFTKEEVTVSNDGDPLATGFEEG